MAEVIIGGVASGITIGTLAAQITNSIIKIKGYWDQIQNAPEDVQDLIEELEIFNNLLTDIEDDQRRNPLSSLIWDSNSTSRCLQYCKKAAERLKGLTETLSVELEAKRKGPRRWASVKVVLKKDKIDRYKSQLERAVKLLSLSYQLYTRIALCNIATSLPPGIIPNHGASLQMLKGLRLTLIRTLLQIQPDIVVAKLSRSMVATPHLCTESASHDHSAPQSNLNTNPAISIRSDRTWSSSLIFGNLVYFRECYSITKGKTRDVAGRKIEVEVIVAEYRSPSWLANKIWHFQAVKASSGWDYSPRIYNVVDGTRSPVFTYAWGNNVRGLQELFCAREASPFDCNDEGWTPLMYAATNSGFKACDLLIEEGADPNYLVRRGEGCYTALQLAMTQPRRGNFEAFPRLLFNETEFTPSLSQYGGSAKGFVLWQEVLDAGYYQRPLEERFKIAKSVTWRNEPERFKIALHRDSILQPWTEETCDTLNVIADSIGWSWNWISAGNKYSFLGDREVCQANLRGWLSMLRGVIAMDYCPHHISYQSLTPLMDLVHRFIHESIHDEEFQLPELLNIWLEGLQDCGVDLEEYGQKETELFQQGLVCREFSPSPPEIWRITSFAYGSSPSDWSIQLELLDDSDTEILSDMPGGWIEDDESEGKWMR